MIHLSEGYQIIIEEITYIIEQLIGDGGQGQCYKAKTIDGELRCVKIMYLKPNAEETEYKINEAALSKKLNHPFIVKFYGSQEIQIEKRKYMAIAMSYCGRGSLKEVIEDNKLNDDQKYDLILQIMFGLCYLNNMTIIHRDIKPENILLNDNGEAIICDFGVSKQTNNQPLQSIVGTRPYMAPEFFGLGAEIMDERVDVWSLGVIAYELVTQMYPFQLPKCKSLTPDFQKIRKGEYVKVTDGTSKLTGIINDFLVVKNRPFIRDYAQQLKTDIIRIYKDYPTQLKFDFESIYKQIIDTSQYSDQKLTLMSTCYKEQKQLQAQLNQDQFKKNQKYVQYTMLIRMIQEFSREGSNYETVMNKFLYYAEYQSNEQFIYELTNFKIDQFHSKLANQKLLLFNLVIQLLVKSKEKE